MDWAALLSDTRLTQAPADPAGRDPARSPFMQDYDRIVFSSAFRRLQDKTQVHPLPQSDYVRRRLTHSLEVSCIGRSLGIHAGHLLAGRGLLPDHVPPADVGFVVAAACLAHDIGNPPFGHAGEDAIGGWFRRRECAALKGELTPAARAGLDSFEGNAQGFRVVARRQMYKNDGGMRLTAATLGAMTKYPRGALYPPAAAHPGKSARKFAFFEQDRALFEAVAASCGLAERAPGLWRRHPLVFLVEAADDICYACVDVEDGYKLGYLDFAEAADALADLARMDRARARDGAGADPGNRIGNLRARAINALVAAVAAAFAARHDGLIDGSFDGALVDETDLRDPHRAAATLAMAKIFRSTQIARVEATGYRVLHGLMDAFAGAVLDRRAGDRLSGEQKRLLALMPEPADPETPLYDQLLTVTDFVSGMTDGYALGLFRELNGVPA